MGRLRSPILTTPHYNNRSPKGLAPTRSLSYAVIPGFGDGTPFSAASNKLGGLSLDTSEVVRTPLCTSLPAGASLILKVK